MLDVTVVALHHKRHMFPLLCLSVISHMALCTRNYQVVKFFLDRLECGKYTLIHTALVIV